ncbi:hypothetical protein BJ912DRAFT_1061894 [Pholiota molesta]|nr:hypothetical protein BJ912DRAFT_1061894 [Pholiota molesta]
MDGEILGGHDKKHELETPDGGERRRQSRTTAACMEHGRWDFLHPCSEAQASGNSIIEAGLDDDLDGFFVGASGPPQNPMAAQNEKEPESALPAEDNWTDIGGVDDQRTEPARGAASKVDDLPAVDSAARSREPPTQLGIHRGLSEEWARIDQNNTAKLPLLKVTMVESAFFSDVIDTVMVEPSYFRGDPEPLNPTLILGFVEGVLGYEETYTNGTRWVFKLDPESHSGTGLLERNCGVL